MSATSMTKSTSERVKTFLTFRVTGDKLTPDYITRIFQVPPAHAYSKGEKHVEGPRTPLSRGRPGVWYLSTDRLSASNKLNDHLGVLFSICFSPLDGALPLVGLQQAMRRKNLKAYLTIFWHGRAGHKKPTLQRRSQN